MDKDYEYYLYPRGLGFATIGKTTTFTRLTTFLAVFFVVQGAYNKHGEEIGNRVEAHEANHRNLKEDLKAKKKSKTTAKSK